MQRGCCDNTHQQGDGLLDWKCEQRVLCRERQHLTQVRKRFELQRLVVCLQGRHNILLVMCDGVIEADHGGCTLKRELPMETAPGKTSSRPAPSFRSSPCSALRAIVVVFPSNT